MKRQKIRRGLSGRVRKRIVIICTATLIVFVAVNAVLWVAYRNRTYPRTSVMGTAIGSVPYGELAQAIGHRDLLPTKLAFSYDKQKTEVSLSDLGIRRDISRAIDSARKQQSWLPLLNLFKTTRLQAPVSIDTTVLDSQALTLAKTFRKDPLNAHLILSKDIVGIATAQNGYELQQKQLRSVILTHLDKGNTSIAIPVERTTPKVQADSLADEQKELQAQLKTVITYRFNGKSKQAGSADIAQWYVPSGEVYAVSPDKLQAYIASVGQGFGIRVKNISQAVSSTQQALASHKPLDLILVQRIALKTYTYCVAAKGVDASHLPVFRSKLQSTLNNARGWSLNGLVEFKEVSAGCGFTAWLTAAGLMPTFGAICDPMWSCRVGPNVVINFDRWQGASPAWNAAGGALDEYRNMVINHEIGHWLSFGHSHCPGAGQPAPVMQQQSIDLQGCAFNAWPTPGELASLRSKLGI